MGLLESEGVAARVAGSELMDEFSASQRLLGPSEVVVKAEDLALATDVVAAWRAGKAGAEQGPDDHRPEGGAGAPGGPT